MKVVHWMETCQSFRPGRRAQSLYDANTSKAEKYAVSWRMCQLCCPDFLPDTLASRGIEAQAYAICQRRFCIPCLIMRNVDKPAYLRMYCPQSGGIELMCNRCAADYAAQHIAQQDHHRATLEVQRLRAKLWDLGVYPDS